MGGRTARKRKLRKVTVNIKPLSVNQCWQGRRFKTVTYKQYEKDLLGLLPENVRIPNSGHITLSIEFGISSPASDIDNGIKPFVDILQKKYEFNDNRIYLLLVHKQKVSRGDEYIMFKVSQYKGKLWEKIWEWLSN